jgi:hypothetical protein
VRRRAVRLIVLAAVTLALGCARAAVDLANTNLSQSELAALVDSDAARQLLDELLERPPFGPRLAALPSSAPATASLENGTTAAARLPDQAELRDLGERVSVDFAALAFARALLADPRSRDVQAAFQRFVRAGAERSAAALQRPGAFPYRLLFAPSWLHRSHPATGSDFAEQRRVLDRLELPNQLIPTGETDSVEDNARVILSSLRAAVREARPVVLVTASKAGAEAALALSRLTPDESAGVAAWVNIAGALHGTPLADAALMPPFSWLAQRIFRMRDWDWVSVTSLATEASRQRLAGLKLPEALTVINLVAVPVSGSVSSRVYPAYQMLLYQGPSDGVIPLAGTVWPGGVNLVALGADHLFKRWREDAYVLALLRAVDMAITLHRPAPATVAGRDAD